MALITPRLSLCVAVLAIGLASCGGESDGELPTNATDNNAQIPSEQIDDQVTDDPTPEPAPQPTLDLDPTQDPVPQVDPTDPSALTVMNYEVALAESLAYLRGEFMIQVLSDLEHAGYVNSNGRINDLLGNPDRFAPAPIRVTRTLDCAGGGQTELSGTQTPMSSEATLVFRNCRHSDFLFTGAVNFSILSGFNVNIFTYGFSDFSQVNDDQSIKTLSGELETRLDSLRGPGGTIFTTSINISFFTEAKPDGLLTTVFGSNYSLVYEKSGVYLDDGSVVFDLKYNETGSGDFTIPSVSGIIQLALEPGLTYPPTNQSAVTPDYATVPSEGVLSMSVKNSDGNTVPGLQVYPGAEASGTVVYEISSGEMTRIESDFFPAAECWFAPESHWGDLTCYRESRR